MINYDLFLLSRARVTLPITQAVEVEEVRAHARAGNTGTALMRSDSIFFAMFAAERWRLVTDRGRDDW
jgi:hypothetical protein